MQLFWTMNLKKKKKRITMEIKYDPVHDIQKKAYFD